MKFGVVRFPGSCDEVDALLACERVPGASAQLLWHGDAELHGVEAIVIPGGFSYGDYLRVGAIARFSPVMESVIRFAKDGGLVLGICNGFQVLCEAGLLPGALLPNLGLRFICRQVNVEVMRSSHPFTGDMADGEILSIPVKHQAGRYYAPPELLESMQAHEQIVMTYAREGDRLSGNPNGSSNDIAGVCNEDGNVFGLMPHPEHAVDPLTGSADGLKIFTSMAHAHG